MTKEYKPFGELPREEQLALFEAWLDGATIELQDIRGDWQVSYSPNWIPEYKYRLALTKPSINWDHVHPDYNWMATDKNGTTYFYKTEPEQGGLMWGDDVGVDVGCTKAGSHISFKAGTCDWKDSLVQRPTSKPPY